MKKSIRNTLAVAGLALTLTACSATAEAGGPTLDHQQGYQVNSPGDSESFVSGTFEQKLPGGDKVLCVNAYAGYYGGSSISCDWEGYHKTHPNADPMKK